MNRRDHGDGGIDQRGPDRWRLRWRVGGKRFTKSFQGSIGDARKELRRLIKSADDGAHVAPARLILADYLRDWLYADPRISPKTRERYCQLAERQIIPHLGAVVLQKLRPVQVSEWHTDLLKSGGKDGKSLAARTVGHAHRVLHRGLERAVALEIISRNAAHPVPPPKVDREEVAILSAGQIADTLSRIEDHPLYPIAALAVATGMRRGELCGLTWGAVDLDAATVRVERSLEETAAGLRVKPPKTRHGHRTISLPKSTVETLRDHHRRQLEQHMLLGLGRPGAEDWVFPLLDGSPYPPDKLSRDWGNVVRDRKLPRVMFHALRHSHASALIAAGVDIVTVSKRLGHGSPAITLGVYAHLFNRTDALAAQAIERALGSNLGPNA
jgi:integrase